MSAVSYGFRHGNSLIIRPLKLTLDTLHRTSRVSPPGPISLSGDEALLVGEAADAIRARVKRAGFEEREVHFIERVADWDEVRAASNNLSLFGSRKLIELRLPSGKPGVGGANAIVELLANASPDNVYLMLTGKLEREQNELGVGEGIRDRGRVAADLAGGARAPAAVAARARRDARARARRRRRAVHRRAHRGQPAGRATGARETQAAARRGKRVDLAAVQASIGDSARFDVFQLGEAALGGDVPRALRILAGLRSEGVEPTLALWSHRARDPQCLGHHADRGLTRAAGRNLRPRSKTPSAARRNCRMRGSRRASRAPTA